ncbi:universal stress protein [Streptacidiphilus sp. PB12-B1b]|uniref:universal stress protein n=1 Tax=Streptacidiphilus sp. PB12-B1b TaxID=2705012 RepID=UPI0015F9075E|nr:universal stress protein [Streptacidiphilus sp. PB12-B1b]QMU78040.1 universal stress protein [Streptacidiphilus sp. PB12-B1b]
MNAPSAPGVVVGIDATPQAEQALDWAAEQAAERGVPLHIVHSWVLAPYQVPVEEQGDIAEESVRAARTLLDAAISRVRERHGGLAVSGEILAEGAVPGLVRIADRADLLVVGSRGRNRLASTLLGSVSQSLAAHAPCPLVVLTGPPQQPDAAGAVVLGAAPGEAAAPVDFAFAEAARRGARLRVVRTWLYPQVYPGLVAVPVPDETDRMRAEAEELAEVLEQARKEFPDVEVVQEVRVDEPDAALVDASTGAALLVVGAKRNHHRFAMPMGPVTQRVLHHAHCPVAVVPHG